MIKAPVWLSDQLSFFNIFFDVDWEVSCSASIVDAVADSSEGSKLCVWCGTSAEPKVNNLFFFLPTLFKRWSRCRGKTLFKITDVVIITTLVGLIILHAIFLQLYRLSKLISHIDNNVFLFKLKKNSSFLKDGIKKTPTRKIQFPPIKLPPGKFPLGKFPPRKSSPGIFPPMFLFPPLLSLILLKRLLCNCIF